MKAPFRELVLIIAVTGALASGACGPSPHTCSEMFDREPSVFTGPVDDPKDLDDYHVDLDHVQSTSWVDFMVPNQAFAGFNLVLYERRVPMLLDMNGAIVHSWPKVRAVGRMRLDRCGRLAVIGRDNLLKEYDWDGNLRWFWKAPGDDFPHHDFIRLENLNYLIIVQEDKDRTDYLVEVDRRGKIQWKWRSADILEEEFPDYDREMYSPTHFNSVNELPPNPLFDQGDSRFRPGNILVSGRNLNTIFIVDKESGDIVWRFEEGLDYQHEAIMMPKGHPDAGRIVFFNNGYHNLAAFRSSAVVVIDPVAGTVEGEYRKPGFFSSVAGTGQPLPNGNVLVTSSEGGRVFEITPAHEVVWQWLPPFRPMRALRYPPDHCPQLAALTLPEPQAVPVPAKPPFFDVELFSLTLPEEHRVTFFEGQRRRLLVDLQACGQLVMPEEPRIKTCYGLRRERAHELEGPVSFTVTLYPIEDDDASPVVLLNDVVGPDDDELWRVKHRPIRGFDRRRIRLCVEARGTGGDDPNLVREIAVWENPTVISKKLRLYEQRPDLPPNLEEERIREQQLRAIGYIQ